MAKWSKLEGRYLPSPLGSMSAAGDPSYVARVDLKKVEYSGKKLGELIAAHTGLDAEKDELSARIKEINAELEALGQLIIAQLEDQGVNSVKSDGGRTVFISVEPYVGVADRAAFEAHVVGQPDLDYLWSVHPGTLGTFIKGLLEEGRDEEVPPGLNIFLKKSIRSRKS